MEGVKAVLAEYVDFRPAEPRELGPMVASASGRRLAAAPTGPRKGMLLREADELFGRADRDCGAQRGQARRCVTRTYSTVDGKLTAEFVEGVLIRYQVTSK